MLVALTAAEAETKSAATTNAEVEQKQDTKVEATDNNNGETAKNKRGLHASLGDYASFGGGHESYAHTDFGHHGGDFGGHGDFGGGHGGWQGSFGSGHDFGASEHHHEHVKHITVEKKIPV